MPEQARLFARPYSPLAQMDCLEWLRTVPDEEFDLVLTDPAYASLDKHRAVGTTTRLDNWFEAFPNSRFPEFFREVHRTLKPDTHFYMMCDAETMFIVKPMAEAAGFRFWKPIVWRKDRIGMGYHYRAQCEFVLFFEKGKRQLNDLGVSDVLDAKRVDKQYPTQKPVDLCEVFVMQSSQPGELVADPFMGSGSVGVAALNLGRRFAGCDKSEAAIAMTRERLAEAACR